MDCHLVAKLISTFLVGYGNHALNFLSKLVFSLCHTLPESLKLHLSCRCIFVFSVSSIEARNQLLKISSNIFCEVRYVGRCLFLHAHLKQFGFFISCYLTLVAYLVERVQECFKWSSSGKLWKSRQQLADPVIVIATAVTLSSTIATRGGVVT